MSEVYEVILRLDKDWLDQFTTWTEFAEVSEDEVFKIIDISRVEND